MNLTKLNTTENELANFDKAQMTLTKLEKVKNEPDDAWDDWKWTY